MAGLLSDLTAKEMLSFMGGLEREGVKAEHIRFILRYRLFENRLAGELKRGAELVEIALTAPTLKQRLAALVLIEDPEALRDICLATKDRIACVALEKLPWNYAAMIAMRHNDLKIVSLAMRKVIDPLLEEWIRNWLHGPRRRRALMERSRRRREREK